MMETRGPEEMRQMRHASHVATTYAAFLKDLGRIGNISGEDAQKAAVVVLHVLEQRIARSLGRHLEAQLPFKLQELLAEAERAEGAEFSRFGRRRLLQMVANQLGKSPAEVEPVVRAVFQAVRIHITDGEAQNVAAGLPE